jgi:phosphoglycolate/pyridoxal phosphate phosphatase family enzyme
MAARDLDKFTEAQRRALHAEIDCFVFDCDGVLWTGDQAIDGARELLHQLASSNSSEHADTSSSSSSSSSSSFSSSSSSSCSSSSLAPSTASAAAAAAQAFTSATNRSGSKQVIFVTNNATKTKTAFEHKFQQLGFPAPRPGTLMSSGIATAAFLARKLKHGDKVYVVGEPGLHDTIRQTGLQTFGQEHASLGFKDFVASNPKRLLSNPDQVKAVVLSFCGNLSYFNIAYAATLVRYTDVLFLCTNRDQASPLIPGLLVPGGGACVAPVVVGSGREPLCMGKPSRDLAQQIAKQCSVDPSRMLMIGDRLNTDMKFGKSIGMRTLLVLSGATGGEEAWACPDDSDSRPDFIASSVEGLVLKSLNYFGASDGGNGVDGYAGDVSSAGETADESSRPSANKRRRKNRNHRYSNNSFE